MERLKAEKLLGTKVRCHTVSLLLHSIGQNKSLGQLRLKVYWEEKTPPLKGRSDKSHITKEWCTGMEGTVAIYANTLSQ